MNTFCIQYFLYTAVMERVLPSSDFMNRIRALEAELFGDALDPAHATRMKSDDYSWLYRPSHHIETGLITEDDVHALKNGNKLLSVGACPAHLERLLVALGVPGENIVIADSNPLLKDIPSSMESLVFDCTKEWPALGLFDLIIFPESLCIALTDTLKKENIQSDDTAFPTDAREAELLTHIMKESFDHLTSNGVIRANGPMSHPNVWKKTSAALNASGYPHNLSYDRYFIALTK